tara:strand:- start:365 stop:2056 length:1692 start_codon:yes stop_codon:yes gene_type:complete
MDFIQKAKEEGLHIRNYSFGQHKERCPRCSHLRKKKSDMPLSVNIAKDSITWTCHHCEWQGGFNDKNNVTAFERPAPPKDITSPISTDLSENAGLWLQNRGISRVTAEKFGLYTLNNNLCFPYYYDGKVVNIKHRSKDKRFSQEAGALQTLFNIDRLKESWKVKKSVIFVEGEMDVLALAECSINNCVSLPNGAPKQAKYADDDKRFSAFAQSEWIFDADEVIIFTDQDEAGKALQLELVHRFGKDICRLVKLPNSEDGTIIKDANEALVKLGKQSVIDAVVNAEAFPIEGVHRPREYHDMVQDIYEGKTQKAYSTGFKKLDEIYKIMPSTFHLVTGIPNHGKSNFLDQILMNLAEDLGWKFAVYSPEHSTPNHLRRLLEKRVRKPFDIGEYERMSQDELNSGIDFIDHHFRFIENTDAIPTIEYILQKAKVAKIRYGINGLVIDPFNQISPERDYNKREDEHIRDIIAKCQQFARNHQTVVWMVAHPHKLHRNDSGVIPPPDLYQVSGSAHWANMADVGLVIHRDFEHNFTQIITRKIREQGVYGNIGMVEFLFNMKTRCYQ